MPNPARRTFRHVSRFASPLHGVPSPTIRSFRIVSHFGSPLHGVPNPTMRSFRVVSCFTGCPIPELRLCQQQVHRLSRYGCVLLCVSRQCAEPHALRTPPKTRTSPFSPTSSKAIRWCSVTPLVPTSSGWHGGTCKCFAPLHEIGTRHIDAARQLQDRRCLWWLYRTRTQPRCVERVSSRGNATSPQQVVLRGCQSAARSNKAQ